MNYKMIRFVISWVLKVEGMLMLLPALVGAMYQEKAGFAYLIWGLLCIAAGNYGGNSVLYQCAV